MRFLLISGLGPANINSHALDGTLLGREVSPELAASYARLAGQPVDLRTMRRAGPDGGPLLREAYGVIPHLPTFTVRSLLEEIGIDFEWVDTESIWRGGQEPSGDFDVVGVSTTFIWAAATMDQVIRWVADRYPEATLVLGGQYSNLRYTEILNAHPEVDFIVRGDAEFALPALVAALDGRGDLGAVANLAWRDPDGTVQAPPIEYIDIEAHPSPVFRGSHAMVPYESMRGCPFTCKFCSFPFASPTWRYKSAEKIVSDWATYAEVNDAKVIKSMDSVFTIPPTRLRRLLELLPALGVQWEGYSRANTLGSREIVQQLEAAHCRYILIGFEAMNAKALKNMEKKVTLQQNYRAVEALRGTTIEVHSAFMVGYPGETPEDYALTHDFLLKEFQGTFSLNFFMFWDETMPVWQDAPIYQLEVTNSHTWKHCGMDSTTAMQLRQNTLHEMRWKNDHAVQSLWQNVYQRPLLPNAPLSSNRRVEKAIERLAHLVKDHGETPASADRCRGLLGELETLGVVPS